MRKSRFTPEQIVGMLREAEAGAKITELTRRHGITETTFHRWRKKYGGMQVSEAKRLRALEGRKPPAEALGGRPGAESPGRERPAGKNVVTVEGRRRAVSTAMAIADLSERQACRYTGFARSTQRYRRVAAPPDHAILEARLVTLAADRPRWGYRRLH